jgi:small multidrug resistance family-3 protein
LRTGGIVIGNLFAFAVAAALEIAGCFPFWMWLRRGHSWTVAAVGVVSPIGFASMLTRVYAGFAGRAYAAYGGVYIAASLAWLWGIEGQRPTAADLLGATLAIAGAVVIVGAASRRAAALFP